jgi:hypothetical protein
MRLACLILTILPMLAACAPADRSVDAKLDANFGSGELVLSCRASASGTCYAIFLVDGEIVRGEAAAGASSSIGGVGEGAEYCVGAQLPDPSKCHPRALVQGTQIFHRSTGKRG